MSLPESYRSHFVSQLHNSLSGFNGDDIDEAVRLVLRWISGFWRRCAHSAFMHAFRYAEQAQTKCIGITIETRPDYCLKPHLSSMLRYGCTR